MASSREIRQALDSQLNSINGFPPIHWQNVEFTQTSGIYVSQSYLSTGNIEVGSSGRNDTKIGIMQLIINVPKGSGRNGWLDVMEQIENAFLRQTVLQFGNTRVAIRKVEERPPLGDESYFKVPIDVYYAAN